MYINANLQTCSAPMPGGVLLTDDLAAKLTKCRPYARAVTDAAGNLIDIECDEDAAAEAKEEKEAREREREEKEQAKATRRKRKKLLEAFDCYKSNLQYFDGTETEAEHAEIVEWYNALLDITDNITAGETLEFPDVPAGIQKYL